MEEQQITDLQSSYDRVAEEYARRIFGELKDKPLDRQLLDELAQALHGKGVICDLGCGPGQVARYLHERGVPVVGFDLSAGQVEQARQLNPGIEFFQGDMLALDVADGAWAGIAAFYSIIHVPREKISAALQELKRTLQPDGLLLLAFHIGGETLHLDEWWEQPVCLDFFFFQPEEMADYLLSAGFEIVKTVTREPYAEAVEHQSRRAYILARKGNAASAYLERIVQRYPEMDIRSARLNAEGLANTVVVVDDWVFRFPRTDADRQQLQYEAELFEILRRYISLPVPTIVDLNDDFAMQPYLHGQPLYRHDLLRCAAKVRDNYARQLASFLRELHDTPLEEVPAPPWLPDKVAQERRQYFLDQLAVTRDTLYPLLWSDQRAWVEDLFAGVTDGRLDLDGFVPALTHRDLAPAHILHDPQQQRLTGIIDFGTAAPSDPAEDLGMIISLYGESYLKRMGSIYPLTPDIVNRARFYAAALEIEWALKGVQKQNPEWLLVHMGRARDSLPVLADET